MTESALSFAHRHIPAAGAFAGTTLLLLHGTGGTETDLLDLGREVLRGATLLSPRGKVLENGLPRFFRRLGEGVFDIEDVKRRTHELADFVTEACDAYALDLRRVIAVGYSNGANIAVSMLFLRPETLQAAVLFRPMIPLVPPQPPDLIGKRVLVAAGQSDPLVKASQTQKLFDLLSGAGADVAVHMHPGGHELGQDDIAAARSWLREHIVDEQAR